MLAAVLAMLAAVYDGALFPLESANNGPSTRAASHNMAAILNPYAITARVA
jgi:hypothetical protein